MDMTIANLVVAVLCVVMLGVLMVHIHGLRDSVIELSAKLKAVTARTTTPQLPGLEERLAAIEKGIGQLSVAYGRLDRLIRSQSASHVDVSPAAAVPSSSVSQPEAGKPVDFDKRLADQAFQLRPDLSATAPLAAVRSNDGSSAANGIEHIATPDDLIEGYREIIARPRKNEIARWFEDWKGIPCEATDENVFQLVGRGDGARLMLLPLTERVALVLPSALMVVDFATSFADVLSARSAVRQTFGLDADGTGTLQLIEAATAVMADGVWKLKAPGRLAGLTNG
jgi:hypothetical protein